MYNYLGYKTVFIILYSRQYEGAKMKTAVRYYSRLGNTKAIAEAIASVAGVEAISVDKDNAKIYEETDVLFIGGALYAYGLDNHLNDYLNKLDGSLIKKAIIFSSTWISKHSIELIRNKLVEKGVDVSDDYFYVRGKPSESQLLEASRFGEKHL